MRVMIADLTNDWSDKAVPDTYMYNTVLYLGTMKEINCDVMTPDLPDD